MIDLQGKNAIVTGASGGIGQAVAATLARAGANVAVCGQNPERLEKAAQGVRDAGTKVQVVTADLRDDAGIKGAIDGVIREWDRIDVLVNNAGITRDGLIIRMSDEDWDDVMDVNLK
jgi:3-oxoacyl-[acyl-carrier protein] reductase